MRATLPLLLVATALTLSAQQPPNAGGQQIYVTAMEVVADVRDWEGKLPAGLQPPDFIVIEDGVERRVVGVEYLRGERSAPAAAQTGEAPTARRPWQTVLYFETLLSNGSGRIRAVQEVVKHVDKLVALGAVDVVFADPIPVALVWNSRDPQAVREALQKVAGNISINRLAAHRRDFLREVTNLNSLYAMQGTSKKGVPTIIEYGKPPQALPNFDGNDTGEGVMADANMIRPYIDQETQLISRFREALMSWLSSYRRYVPRTLFLVTDGFDLDPLEFYGSLASGNTRVALRTYIENSAFGESANGFAQFLAAGGWTTVSVPSDNNADGWIDDATVSGIGRVRSTMGVGAARQGQVTATDARRPLAMPKVFLYRPLDPLNVIAEDTGGSVVSNSAHIGQVIDGLDDRIRLTYQVDRKPDGKVRKLDIRARDQRLKVRAPRFAASSTPDEIAEVRAIGLLKGASFTGDLPVESSMEWGPAGPKKSGTLRAITNANLVKRMLPMGSPGQFRVTLGVQHGKGATVVNRMIADYDLSEGSFRFRTTLDLPATTSVIVLVIEETTTGFWGSARIEAPNAAAPGVAPAPAGAQGSR
jgi:hypothetical protein